MMRMDVLALVLLFVAVSLAEKCDCDCRYKLCKAHAEKHHEKERCDEKLTICKTCPVGECDAIMEACWAKAETHASKHVCTDAWYKCGICFCRWQSCNKHAEKYHEQNRCNVSLDVCRECDTHECDVTAAKCQSKAKSHADVHKCIDAWQKCGQCMCRYKTCRKQHGNDAKCKHGLDLCKNCNTKKCDGALDGCMKSAKTHADLHVCLDGWYQCVKDSCKD